MKIEGTKGHAQINLTDGATTKCTEGGLESWAGFTEKLLFCRVLIPCWEAHGRVQTQPKTPFLGLAEGTCENQNGVGRQSNM